MTPSTIPIVTYAMARPFVRELECKNVPVDPILRSVGLEPKKLMDDNVYIAAQNWYDFAEAVSEILNDPCLGYSVGVNAAIETLPNLRILELPLATLGELLTTLVIDVQRFSTIAHYSLSTDGVHASLTTKRTFFPKSPPTQIDGYFAGFMVRILSLCAGERWVAKDLRIGVCQPSALPEKVRNDCHVKQVGLEGACFHFPALWLVQRTGGATRQTNLSFSEKGTSFMESFRAMLDLHLDRQGLSLAVFASLTQQSKSTLKRKLQNYGATYQSELDNRRASRAIFLLQATGMSAAEVGERVGYPDPPSFSRAFKRWTGKAPAEFRVSRVSLSSSKS